MELDKRVKALEYEIKILKSEIQRTLLDVQEQILLHYYPSLRSEEGGSSGVMQSIQSVQESLGKMDQPPAEPAEPVAVRQTSLEEIRGGGGGGPSPVQPAAAQEEGAAVMAQLSNWAGTCVEKLGAERTGRLLEACGNRGVLDAETKAALSRVVTMSKDDNPPGAVAVNDTLGLILNLYQLLGRPTDVEEALSTIEEAGLG
jgi:hypothetical protein